MLRPSMRKIALLIVLLAGSQNLPAQNAATNATAASKAPTSAPASNDRPISLAEAVQMALQKNLDIQILRYNPQLSQFALSESFAVYEPSFRISAVREVEE